MNSCNSFFLTKFGFKNCWPLLVVGCDQQFFIPACWLFVPFMEQPFHPLLPPSNRSNFPLGKLSLLITRFVSNFYKASRRVVAFSPVPLQWPIESTCLAYLGVGWPMKLLLDLYLKTSHFAEVGISMGFEITPNNCDPFGNIIPLRFSGIYLSIYLRQLMNFHKDRGGQYMIIHWSLHNGWKCLWPPKLTSPLM